MLSLSSNTSDHSFYTDMCAGVRFFLVIKTQRVMVVGLLGEWICLSSRSFFGMYFPCVTHSVVAQATANFPRLPFLNQTLWKLTEENDLWDWNIAKHYHQVAHTVKEKKEAGFPVSLVE